MLFATHALASQIEAAECGLLADATAAVSRSKPERDVLVVPLAGGVATYSGPDSPLNKVAGLGFGGPVIEAELAEVEGWYATRGVPVQVELSSLADPAIAAMLSARGYRLVAFENVLGRALGGTGAPPLPTVDPDITVSQTGEARFALWLDTAVTGFTNPDGDGVPAHESFPRETLEEVISDMAGAPSFVRYLARLGNEPAGAASMRLHERVAQLTGAATLPAHRRRGVQAALLARRLTDAAQAACEVAVVTTQPGSSSQRNAQRRGFELLYARAVLVLEPE